jgi:hypothetical protein
MISPNASPWPRPRLPAEVALEAIKGQETVAELATKHEPITPCLGPILDMEVLREPQGSSIEGGFAVTG